MKEISQLLKNSWSTLDLNDSIDAINTLGAILGIEHNIPNKYDITETDSELYERVKELYEIVAKEIINEFSSCSGHSIGNLLRGIGITNELEYKEVLSDCCNHLNIEFSNNFDCEKIERVILEQFLNDIWKGLNEDQKNNLKAEIIKVAKEHGDNSLANALLSGAPLGTILALKGTGFGVYLAATTALKSISLLLGTTFSFGVYTGLTNGIGVILGPVGLIGAGAWAIYQIGEPNYKNKIIPAIFVFSSLRANINLKKAK